MNSEYWIEFKPKQYLTKETAKELLVVQDREINELRSDSQHYVNEIRILRDKLNEVKDQRLALTQERDALKAERDHLKAELSREIVKLAGMASSAHDMISQLSEARELLKRTQAAYCGVGDFEGTGQKMAEVMPDIDAFLSTQKRGGAK